MIDEQPSTAAPEPLELVRFRRIAGSWVITTDWGAWAVLQSDEARAFVEGRMAPSDPAFATLAERGLIRDAVSAEQAGRQIGERRSSAFWGPFHHTLNLTHGSPADTAPMSPETAELCVDFVFKSTSPRLTIAFQGPAALANAEALERAVAAAHERNADVHKPLTLELVSDLDGLDQDRLDWLLARGFCMRVQVRAADFVRADAPVWKWLRLIVEARSAAEGEHAVPAPEVVVEPTREVVGLADAILDRCSAVGVERLRLAPPSPPPLALGQVDTCDLDAWLDFYETTVAALIVRGVAGGTLVESTFALLLARILRPRDSHDPLVRSPATDGVGRLAYAADGTVCSSDEGRVLHDQGDESFRLGRAGEDSYRDIVAHATVRALVVATVLEGQPGCTDCAYLPFCGQSPAHNHCEQGTIQGRMADSSWCKRMMRFADLAFGRLSAASAEERAVLESWAASAAPSDID